MANVTVTPGRRLSRIPPARSYSNLASRYAQQFQAAIDQSEQNDLATKLNELRLGNISFDAFKQYTQKLIDAAPAGSSKKADYTGILVSAENFNKTNIENQAQTTVDKLRTQMLEKFPGQVTAKDQLAIVQKLKTAVDKKTDVYDSLVKEETQLKNQIINEAQTTGKGNLSNNLDKYYAALKTENDHLISEYQSGRLTGYELDSQLYQNGLNLANAVAKADAAGVNVPTSYYQAADETGFIQQRLAQREVGQVFDVFDTSGKVQTVTHETLTADQAKTSPDFVRSRYQIEPDPASLGRRLMIVDTSTGQKFGAQSFATQAQASAAIAKLGEKAGWSVVVPQQTANGVVTQKQYNFDPKTQTFSPTDNPGLKVYTPVGDENANKFVAPATGGSLLNFINAGITKLNEFVDKTTGSFNLPGLQAQLNPNRITNPAAPNVNGPFMQPRILTEPTPTPSPTIASQSRIPAPTVTPTSTVAPSPTATTTPRGTQAPMSTQPRQSVQPLQNTLSEVPVSPPAVKSFTPFAGVDFSKLNLNPVTAVQRFFGGGGAQTSGPTMGPSVTSGGGLIDKLRNFGQQAIGSVKNFFGF